MSLTDFQILILSVIGAGCAGAAPLFRDTQKGQSPCLWQVIGEFVKYGIGGAALGNGCVEWLTAEPTAMKKICFSWALGAFPELKNRLAEGFTRRP